MKNTDFKLIQGIDKLNLLAKAQFLESSVYFKFNESLVYKTKMLPVVSKRQLICIRPTSLTRALGKKRATLNFVIDQEIYFMNSQIVIDENSVSFSLQVDLFHLIRRKQKRAKVPEGFEAVLFIRRHNGDLAFSRGKILNFNENGIRAGLNLEYPVLNVGDQIDGKISLGRFSPISFQGTVKHLKTNSEKANKQIFGIRFQEISNHDEKKLLQLARNFQREDLLLKNIL